MNTETITDNEVIARFMDALKKYDERGGMPCVLLSGGGVPVPGWYFNDKEILYSTSWEWLMPVVEKIESECGASVEIRQGYCGIIHHRTKEWQTSHMGSKIESTYKAVVQFIHWYNSTQNKEKV